MKSKTPALLIGIGTLILIGVAGILLYSTFFSAPEKELLPSTLGGLPLNQALYGPEAITWLIQLHGIDIPMEDAAIGRYGTHGEITLWVSIEPDEATATDLNELMSEKINLGRAPFTRPVVSDFGGTPVYVLEGLGQQHYYWQVREAIIWLSADSEFADSVLQACLNFYP